MTEIQRLAREILNNVQEPTYGGWCECLNFLVDNRYTLDQSLKDLLFNRCEWYRQYFNTMRKKVVRTARNSGGILEIEVTIKGEDIAIEDVHPNIYYLKRIGRI